MKKFFLILILLPLAASAAQPDLTKAAAKSKLSVLYISVYSAEKKGGKNNFSKIGYGSGTILTKRGYVITNYHVVSKGDFYQAVMFDGTVLDFEPFPDGMFYKADVPTDLAVMKLKEIPGILFQPVSIDESNTLQEGDWVIAVGSPYGLRHSVTCGIISSLGRYDLGFSDIEDFIQTDVPINPGNSGGPLININGDLVGINSAIRTVSGGYQGISFAIPSYLIKKVFQELTKYGRVRRGWLGILVKDEIQASGLERYNVRVVSVMKNSPAESAGMLEGDIIREADGNPVTSKGKLTQIVKSKELNSSIPLVISRSGKLLTYSLPFREKEEYLKISGTLKILEDRYGIRADVSATGGNVIISSLSPYKIDLHHNSLFPGDRIISINRYRISDLDSFAARFKSEKFILKSIEVMREDNVFYIEFSAGE
jgi:serine protease Do